MKINSYLLIGLLLAASIALIIYIPRWQEENYKNDINATDIEQLKPNERVQLQKDFAIVENSFRATLAQIIGGSLLLLSLYLTYRNVENAQENTRIANETLRLLEKGNFTDRFTKAIDLLADQKLESRLGGIYTLEHIAHGSEKDHWTIMEVLTAFVREKTDEEIEKNVENSALKTTIIEKEPREDVKAIFTVFGRRNWVESEPQRINLTRISLQRYDFRGFKFNRIDLSFSNLTGSNLSKTDWVDVNLTYTDLDSVKLLDADLKESNLNCANLREANLTGAILEKVQNLTLQRLMTSKHFKQALLPAKLKKKISELPL